jgi:hypothetical protein
VEQAYLADPWRASAVAEAAVERAAQELRQVLVALATSLDPFPGFQGLKTLHAVEVDLGSMEDPGRGCVVVGPDGLLYELALHTIHGPLEYGDADQVEELTDLELAPHEYVQYAYRAIQQLAEIKRGRG